jgi:hypothetical protein
LGSVSVHPDAAIGSALMTEGFWFSALIGVGIAGLYSLAALFLGRIAVGSSQRAFMMLVLGGMVARIFVTLILLTLILLLTSLDSTALLAGFFIVFTIGLTAETIILHRQQSNIQKNSKDDSQKD